MGKDKLIKIKCRLIYLELNNYLDRMLAYDLELQKVYVDEKNELILAKVVNVDTGKYKVLAFDDIDFDSYMYRRRKYKDMLLEIGEM